MVFGGQLVHVDGVSPLWRVQKYVVFMIIVLCEVQGRFRVHLSGWQPQKLCSASLCDMGRIVSCTSSLLNMIFFADSSAKDATREGVQNIC